MLSVLDHTSSHDAAVREDNDIDRGGAVEEQVPVGDGGDFNLKPVADGSKRMITGTEEMPGSSLEAVNKVSSTTASENICESVELGSAPPNNHVETPGKNLNGRKFKDQSMEGAGDKSWTLICEVAKQSEEAACFMPVIAERSLLNGSMSHDGVISKDSHFGHRLSPDKITREKQEFGFQSTLSERSGDEVLQQPRTDSKADPVQASSKIDHEIHDNLLNESINMSNVVAEGTSDQMTGCVRVEPALENIAKVNHSSILTEQPEQVEKSGSEAEPDSLEEEQKVEMIGSSAMNCEQRSAVKQVENSQHDLSKGVDGVERNGSAASDEKLGMIEVSIPFSEEEGAKAHVIAFGIPVHGASTKPRRGRRPGVTSATKGKRPVRTSARTVKSPGSASAATDKRPEKSSVTTEKRPRRAFAGSSRVLRSELQDEPVTTEPSSTLENTRGSSAGRRGRKKRSESVGKSEDEFSRMRKHLRYLLHRIGKERNLLDAYSSEGWRGQSLEKLRPEKELERAKKDINRFKLKIREFFQRIDSMSAEGKFPDSLYDSDGLIDCEDIYCAKCGSKDLFIGNDILLCDGACDRGFHQYCLEPPLRSEEIPPGDEGWLCPTCDCKVDCIKLLNDSQGTNLTMEDSWEKVFPEAMATITGHEQIDMSGFPSDDSEDNDYNPDGPNDNAMVEGSEDSSDGSDPDCDSDSDSDSSDFSSASEDLGVVCGDQQNLGLPSDDSEDNDYDPDAVNVKEEKDCGSSSSDFTSDSEDLVGLVADDETLDKGEPSVPCDLDEVMGDSQPLSSKRRVERLDYKKLYDETYRNADEDSSDDEEWTGTTVPGKKRNGALSSADGTDSAVTPKRRGRPKLKKPAPNGSPAELERFPQDSSSGAKCRKRPPYNRLGEAVTQRLYESFKKNQYPDRLTKEKLAEELGLTPLRVDKWFGNARWSLHHHPTRLEASIAKVVPHSSSAHTVACNGAESVSANVGTTIPLCGSADSGELNLEGSSGKISTPQESIKRKKTETNEPMLQTSKTENSEENSQAGQSQTPVKKDLSRDNTKADLLQTPEARRSQRKRRKSVD